MNPGSPAPLTGFDLFIPWIIFAGVVFLLLGSQRWIHRHLFGVGYVISNEKPTATLLYYLALLPGVVVHELSHYLMAGAFNIHSKKFTMIPKAQEDGSLDMGFVQLEQIKNPVYAAFVGSAPLIVGMLLVIWISNSLIALPRFLTQLESADINIIGPAFKEFLGRPDVFFWLYILFAVSNAMMPSKEDRRGWLYIGIAVGVSLAIFLVLGFGFAVQAWLAGPIADALNSLSAVFGSVLFVNLLVMGIIWGAEMLLGRVTGRKYQYQPAVAARLGSGVEFRRVFDLNLPIPPPPGKIPARQPRPQIAAAAAGGPAGGRPEIPALSPGEMEGLPAPAPLPKLPGTPAGAPRLTPGGANAPKPAVGKPAEAPLPKLPAPGSKPSTPLTPAASTSSKPSPGLPPSTSRPGTPAPKPIGGPPAVVRPGNLPAAPKPTLPAAGGPRTFSPAPKPPAASVSRPGQPAKSPFGSRSDDDDYIDADVIEAEEEYIDADVIEEDDDKDDKGNKKDKDDGEQKYVDIDSV